MLKATIYQRVHSKRTKASVTFFPRFVALLKLYK